MSTSVASPTSDVESLEVIPASKNKKPRRSSSISFLCTDAGNAELIAQLFQERLTYDYVQQRWLEWTASHDWNEHPPEQRLRWVKRRTEEMRRFAIEAARMRIEHANRMQDLEKRKNQIRWAMESEYLSRLDAALEIAKSLLASDKKWDGDPWLFGVANGVIDLRTGLLLNEQREHRITKHSPVRFDPDATCPRFKAFVEEIFSGDAELIDYMQRMLGYCLTGLVREQCLSAWYGTGANGKTTLINLLAWIFDDYAVNLPFSALENQNRNSNDLVGLHGARFATAVETREGTRLNEARIKGLTGGDPITAREMYKNNFTFLPTHKLVLAFNHKPVIADDSHGMWRRIHLVPFNRRFEGEQCDKRLLDKLKDEGPGILAWMVRGCLAWQQEGLKMPPAVDAATCAYRDESDHVGEFLKDRCLLEAGAKVQSGILWESYQAWTRDNEEVPLIRKTFAERLKSRGLTADKDAGKRCWFGARLKIPEGFIVTGAGPAPQ